MRNPGTSAETISSRSDFARVLSISARGTVTETFFRQGPVDSICTFRSRRRCPGIEAVDWPGRSIEVDLDREAIESAPDYDPSKVIDAEYEARLLAHYGKSLTQQR